MNVLTKAVFPTLRIIIWAVIAIALVNLAFFQSDVTAEPDDGLEPETEFQTPTVVVELTSITDDISAPATVVADPKTEVKSELDGYVGYWAHSQGDEVAIGEPILELRKPAEDDPDDFTRHTITSPIAGTLQRSLALGTSVGVGDVVFAISPGTTTIEATLTPEERYRLVEKPTTSQVRLTGGPLPFDCDDITINDDPTDTPASSEEAASAGGDETEIKMTCPSPSDIRLVVGLTGTMTVAASELKDVVAAPVTAVQTSGAKSLVWLVDPSSGEQESHEVTLGISDGKVVEVVEGLEVGDEILQFAPGNLDELPSEEPSDEATEESSEEAVEEDE